MQIIKNMLLKMSSTIINMSNVDIGVDSQKPKECSGESCNTPILDPINIQETIDDIKNKIRDGSE